MQSFDGTASHERFSGFERHNHVEISHFASILSHSSPGSETCPWKMLHRQTFQRLCRKMLQVQTIMMELLVIKLIIIVRLDPYYYMPSIAILAQHQKKPNYPSEQSHLTIF